MARYRFTIPTASWTRLANGEWGAKIEISREHKNVLPNKYDRPFEARIVTRAGRVEERRVELIEKRSQGIGMCDVLICLVLPRPGSNPPASVTRLEPRPRRDVRIETFQRDNVEWLERRPRPRPSSPWCRVCGVEKASPNAALPGHCMDCV